MNPILTMAGVVPGGSEMTHWRTGMNPLPTANPNNRNTGPSLSIAGVRPGGPSSWEGRTAYPNGEAIYVVALRRAEAQAALNDRVRQLPQPTAPRRRSKAA